MTSPKEPDASEDSTVSKAHSVTATGDYVPENPAPTPDDPDKIRKVVELIVAWQDEAAECLRSGKPFLDSFTLQGDKEIGAGGFGIVYRANHNVAGDAGQRSQEFALKLVRLSLTDSEKLGFGYESISDKYWDAIKAAAKEVRRQEVLTNVSNGCVPIYDLRAPEPKGKDITVDEMLYHLATQPIWFTMPCYELTLRDLLAQKGELEPDHAVRIMQRVAETLQSLHRKSLYHRDLKPANIMLIDEHQPLLADFGLAIGQFEQELTGNAASGTVEYMAPEQTLGGDVNAATDIWAWGVILYQLVTGELPFGSRRHLSISQIFERIQARKFESPKVKVPTCPDYVVAVIDGCLRNVDEPYDNFADVLDALSIGKSGGSVRKVSAERRREAVLDFLERLALNGLHENLHYLPPKLNPDEGEEDKPESPVTVDDLVNFCLPVRVVDEQEWLEQQRTSPNRSAISSTVNDQDFGFATSEESWRMGGQQRATPRPLEAVLRSSRRVVLVGEAGEGKTTSLFLHVAHRCGALAEGLRTRKFGLFSPECRIPLPLPLSKAAPTQQAEAEKGDEAFGAVDRAQHEALRIAYKKVEDAPPEVAQWLKEKVARGEIDLCLDSLDELDIRWHALLNTELNRPDGFGIFLTTRSYADNQESEKVLPNVRRYRMVHFGPAQVREYITRYFENSRYFVDADQGRQLARELRDQLRHSPGPRQLAQIPLLLALLCDWLATNRHLPMEELREKIPKTRTQLLKNALHSLLDRGDRKRRRPARFSPSERNQVKEAVLCHVAWQFFATGPLPIVQDKLIDVLEQQLKRDDWQSYSPPQNAEALLEEFLQDGVLVVARDRGVYRFVLRSLHEYCLAGWIARECRLVKEDDSEEFIAMIRGRSMEWGRDKWPDIKPFNQPAWETVWPLVAGQLDSPELDFPEHIEWLGNAVRLEHEQAEDIWGSRACLAARLCGELTCRTSLEWARGVLGNWVNDSDRHEDAIFALAQMRDHRAQELLVKCLNNAEEWPGYRRRCAEALGKYGDRCAIQPLVAGLRDADELLRLLCAEALLKFDEARPVLDAVPEWLSDRNMRGGPHMDSLLDSLAELVRDSWNPDSLVDLVKNSDAHSGARRMCAKFIGRLKNPVLVGTLSDLLSDQNTDEGVREYCAESLGDIGDENALKVLIENLNDESIFVTQGCVYALEKIGGKRAATALLAKGNRVAYALALCELDEPGAIDAVALSLREAREPSVQRLLERFGGQLTAEILSEGLKNPHDLARRVCATHLVERHSSVAFNVLFQCLDHLAPWSYDIPYWTCVSRLSALDSRRTIDALVERLNAHEWTQQVPHKTIETLSKLEPNTAIDVLINHVENCSDLTRTEVLRCLLSIGSDLRRTDVINVLTKSLNASSAEAIFVSLSGLGRIDDRTVGHEAIAVLVHILRNHDDVWAKYWAAEALGAVGDPKALDELTAALKDDNPSVRAKVADAIGRIGDTSAVPVLIDGLDDPEKNVAGSCLEALWTIDKREGRQVLERIYLSGPNHAIYHLARHRIDDLRREGWRLLLNGGWDQP